MPCLESRGLPLGKAPKAFCSVDRPHVQPFSTAPLLRSSLKSPQGRGQGGTMFCCAGQVGLRSLLEGADLSAKTSEWVGLGVAWQGGRWKAVGRTAGALQTDSCDSDCVPCVHVLGVGGSLGLRQWLHPDHHLLRCVITQHTRCVSGSLGPMCWQRWASWPASLEPQGGAGPLGQWGGPKATSLLQAVLQTTGSIPTSAISSNHGGGTQSPHLSGCSSRFSQLQIEGAHLAMTGASSRAEIHDVDAGTARSSGACPPAFHGARGRRCPS